MARFFEILATATVTIVLAAGVAHADSRLFGARSDQNGVNVTSANLDGKDLAVAGQGGGTTYFRIDKPGGSVPCTNHIAFTGSNGLVATIDANVCTNGGQVTVPFTTAGVPPPPAASPEPATPTAVPTAPAPAAGRPAGTQAVTISVDDPNVSVDSVFMAGKPVAINRRIGNAVEVLVAPGADGITCARDLGLVLSDGRRIARSVDICANGGQVSVSLLSSAGTAATAAPQPPPPSPPTPAAPTVPAAPQAAGVASDAVWMFTSTRDNGSLAFAVPNSEDSELTAVCAPGSNEATLALGRSAAEVQPGRNVTVSFSAGTFAQSYRAKGSEVSQMTGLSNPLIKLKTDDPLWQAIIHESALAIQIGSAAPYALPLRGSAAQARPFLAYCSPAPVAPAAPTYSGQPIPSPDSGSIPFACDDGSFINVVFDDANARVIVTDPAAGPPMSLRRVASRQGARYVGRGGDELVGYAETISWSRGGSYPATCRPR